MGAAGFEPARTSEAHQLPKLARLPLSARAHSVKGFCPPSGKELAAPPRWPDPQAAYRASREFRGAAGSYSGGGIAASVPAIILIIRGRAIVHRYRLGSRPIPVDSLHTEPSTSIIAELFLLGHAVEAPPNR